MAQAKNTLWRRYKYKISGIVLILPIYFLYHSLFPKFPDVWETKEIGVFKVSPMPFDLDPPYIHGGHYTKDFFITFGQGNVADIRQAYLNIGTDSLSLNELEKGDEGILHGSQHGQEVHAIAPPVIKPEHKAWLTIETWKGEKLVIHWDIPQELLR